MKIKELDVDERLGKTFPERKKDAMNWFLIALKMCFRFLKQYLVENKFEEFIECEKQIASYCEKFRRTVGAIQDEEIRCIIDEEIEKAFVVFEDLPKIE